jgi:hypothetical protein
MSERVDLFIKATLFADALYEVEPAEKAVQFDAGHADLPNPVARFFEKAERDLLTKNVDGISETSWDEPLTKASDTDPAALPARSQARLEKAFGVIDRVFFGHPQECEEAKSIARRLLLDVRADIMAAA